MRKPRSRQWSYPGEDISRRYPLSSGRLLSAETSAEDALADALALDTAVEVRRQQSEAATERPEEDTAVEARAGGMATAPGDNADTAVAAEARSGALVEPGESGAPLADQVYWENRVRFLQQRLAVAESRTDKVELLEEIGRTWYEKLQDREFAAPVFEQLLEIEPSHPLAQAVLERIYRVEWQTEKLIDLLITRAELAQSAAERVEVLRDVARLYEQMGDPQKAALVIETALEAQPRRDTLVVHLEQLRTSRGTQAGQPAGEERVAPEEAATRASPDPIALLEERLNEPHSADEAAEIYEQMGHLWLRRRGQRERAIDCFRRALRVDPARLSCCDQLEQIFRLEGRHEDLVRLLEDQVDLATGVAKGELLLRVGQIYEGPLGDPAGALACYRAAMALLSGSEAAQRVARVAEETQRWDAAVEALEVLLRRTRSDAKCVELLDRLARCRIATGDVVGARQDLERLLERAPAKRTAVDRLVELYREQGEWGKALRVLRRAVEVCELPTRTARWLLAAAKIADEQLEDEQQAAELYRRTFEVDPDNAEAAEPLLDISLKREDYAGAEGLLRLLLRKADREDPVRMHQLHQQMAFVCKALGSWEQALEHYRFAYQYAPGDRTTLAALAALLFRQQDWQGAADAYQELVAQGGGTGDALLREGLLKLGHCAVKLQDRARAIDAFERVLEYDGEDQRALRALADLQAAGEDWTAVVRSKLALLAAAGQEQRYEIYREVADIYWNRLGQAAEAEACYRRALDARPEGREALQDLIELYSANERWEETIEICETIAQLEQRPAFRAKYWFAAAMICRRKLQDIDRAVTYLNHTLDVDRERLEAFEAIDQLLTAKRDWKKLQHNYGKMLKRLSNDGPRELRVMLWHNLGEILRSRRRDFEGAIAAFEAAQRLDPDNEGRLKILAELYLTSGAAYRDRAIAAYHELIKRWPNQIGSYQTLRRLLMEGGASDRAWCVCAALSYVRRADEEEQRFFRRHRRREVVWARGQVTDDLWRHNLAHESQDPQLGVLLTMVTPVVASLSARAHARFGLRRKERYDPAAGSEHFYEIFSYATRALNVVEADLYLRPREQVGMLMAHTSGGPSLVVGAELLGRDPWHTHFIVGRQLTFLRPEHFLRGVLGAPSQLLAVLVAVRRLFGDAVVPDGLKSRVEQIRGQLRRRLTQAQLEQLGRVVEQLGPVEQVDLLRWWNAAELTAERVGFFLCNDLAAAAEVVGNTTVMGGASPRERIRELVKYSVSQEYLDLRERVGLSIEGP